MRERNDEHFVPATEEPDGIEVALDREKATALAALAASMWCGRAGTDRPSSRDLLATLMDAAAWTSRARRHRDMPPLAVAELIESFERPTADWLPGAGAFQLVENGEPTSLCAEFADATGSSPLAEVEQGVIKQAMLNVAGRADATEAYATFRRFLVENAHAPRAAAARSIRGVGLELGTVYGPVAGRARLSLGGREVFFPCPRCRWPMTVRGDGVACDRSSTCLAVGSRFALRDDQLVALGRLAPPTRVPADEVAAVRPGIWRYTVLPGIEELDLAERLGRIDGTRVVLWPLVDAYDLDVRRGDQQWRVDVKDHVSVVGLARHLSERPAREATLIVVPDHRREQVPILRRSVPSDAGYSFTSSRHFVQRVKGAA